MRKHTRGKYPGSIIAVGAAMMGIVAVIGIVVAYSGVIDGTYMDLAFETPKFNYSIEPVENGVPQETGNEMFAVYKNIRLIGIGLFGVVLIFAALSRVFEASELGIMREGTANSMMAKSLLFILIMFVFPPMWDAAADGMTNISYWVLNPDYSFDTPAPDGVGILKCPVSWGNTGDSAVPWSRDVYDVAVREEFLASPYIYVSEKIRFGGEKEVREIDTDDTDPPKLNGVSLVKTGTGAKLKLVFNEPVLPYPSSFIVNVGYSESRKDVISAVGGRIVEVDFRGNVPEGHAVHLTITNITDQNLNRLSVNPVYYMCNPYEEDVGQCNKITREHEDYNEAELTGLEPIAGFDDRPRLISAEVSGLNQVALIFSEPVFTKDGSVVIADIGPAPTVGARGVVVDTGRNVTSMTAGPSEIIVVNFDGPALQQDQQVRVFLPQAVDSASQKLWADPDVRQLPLSGISKKPGAASIDDLVYANLTEDGGTGITATGHNIDKGFEIFGADPLDAIEDFDVVREKVCEPNLKVKYVFGQMLRATEDGESFSNNIPGGEGLSDFSTKLTGANSVQIGHYQTMKVTHDQITIQVKQKGTYEPRTTTNNGISEDDCTDKNAITRHKDNFTVEGCGTRYLNVTFAGEPIGPKDIIRININGGEFGDGTEINQQLETGFKPPQSMTNNVRDGIIGTPKEITSELDGDDFGGNYLANIGSNIQKGGEGIFMNLILGLTKALVALQILILSIMMGIMADMIIAMAVTGLPIFLMLSLIPKADEISGKMIAVVPAGLLLPLMSAIIIVVGAAVVFDAGAKGAVDAHFATWITSMAVVFFAITLPVIMIPILGGVSQMATQVVSSAVSTATMATSMVAGSAGAAMKGAKGAMKPGAGLSKIIPGMLKAGLMGAGAGAMGSMGKAGMPGIGGADAGINKAASAGEAGVKIGGANASLSHEDSQKLIQDHYDSGKTRSNGEKILNKFDKDGEKWNDAHNSPEKNRENVDNVVQRIKNDKSYENLPDKDKNLIKNWEGPRGDYNEDGKYDLEEKKNTIAALSEKDERFANLKPAEQMRIVDGADPKTLGGAGQGTSQGNTGGQGSGGQGGDNQGTQQSTPEGEKAETAESAKQHTDEIKDSVKKGNEETKQEIKDLKDSAGPSAGQGGDNQGPQQGSGGQGGQGGDNQPSQSQESTQDADRPNSKDGKKKD